MKAVAVTDMDTVVVVDDVPMPVMGEYDALVRVKASGICTSTDRKIMRRELPDNPRFPFSYPSILGHEGVGEVVDVGAKVRSFKVGDRVVCPLPVGIPDCKYSMNYGGMAEYSIAPDIPAQKADGVEVSVPWLSHVEKIDFLCKVFPREISYVDAVMILTFKEIYSAIRNFDVKEGMDILIFGDGVNGMGLALNLRDYRVNQVVVAGHHDEKLQRIRKISSPDRTINTKKEDVEQAVGAQRFDIVIDAVGSIEIIKQGAKVLKPGGKVCVFGVLPSGKSTINLNDLPNYTAVQILSYPYRQHRTHDTIVKHMLDGTIRASDFYSHVMPVDEAPKAFDLLKKREAFKVILTFDDNLNSSQAKGQNR